MVNCIIEEDCGTQMEVDDDQVRSPESKTDRNPLKWEVDTVLDAEIRLASATELEKCTNKDLLYIDIKVKSENLEKIDLARHLWIKDLEKPVFVTFRSSKEVIFYWRACKSDNFYSLSISEESNGIVASFCEKFLISEIINKRNGIIKSSKGKRQIYINDIGTIQGCNLLRMAVMRNDINLVQSLQQFNLNVDNKDDNGCKPIDSAWSIYCNSEDLNEKDKSSKILMILLTAGSRIAMKILDISKEFVYEEASAEVKEFLDCKQKWHDYVENDDLESLEKLFDENPNYYHHCYNRYNQSLMMTATESENDEIQDRLSENGCTIGSHEIEDFKRIMNQKATWKVARHSKRIKLDAHKNPLSHIYILEANSIIVNSVPNYHSNWKHIRKALRFLNTIETCSLILQLAATVNNLTIEWDFELDRVCYMLPTRSVNSVGCSDINGTIYIAAMDLLDEEKKHAVYGVIIHEFCHIAVDATYMNNFLPYPVGESIEKDDFRNNIVKECEEFKHEENLIDIAFDKDVENSYELEDIRDCELIVRPIHIMIHYSLYPDNIQSCKETFSKLFGYLNHVIVDDMKEALALIPKLQDKEEIVHFEDLTNPMKVKIYYSKVKFHGIENSFQEILKNFETFENVLELYDLHSESIKNCLLHNQIIQFGEANIATTELEIELINRRFILNDSFTQEENNEKDIKNVDDIIQLVKTSKAFILADESGTGKTISLKKIKKYLQVNNSFTDHWFLFITLKEHEDYFLKNKNQNLDVLSMLRTIQKLDPGIESEIFNIMFKNGKVILFFDGFDEICPQLEDFFILFLKTIKNPNITQDENGENIQKKNNENQIWISSRLQYKSHLESALNVKSFKFEPLSREETEDLFIQTYNKHKKDNQREMKTVLSDFDKFFKLINTDRHSQQLSDSFDLNNPLLIKIIAELYANDEIEVNSKSLNLFNIFDKITSKVREAGDSKVSTGDKDPTMTHFTLGHVFQVLALLYFYTFDFIKDLSIIKLWEQEKANWKIDKIQRFGFVNLDPEFDNNSDREHIHFTHRSYAEYFLAKYIITFFTCGFKIDDEDLEIILNKISRGFDYGIIFKFILSAMKNDKNIKIKNEVNLNKLKNLLIKTKNDFENDKEAEDFNRFQSSLNQMFIIKTEIIFKYLCVFLLNNRGILEELFLSKKEDNFLEFVFLKGNHYFLGIKALIEVLEIVFGLKWNKFFIRITNMKKYKFNKNNIPYVHSDSTYRTNLARTLKIFEFVENEFNAAERLSIYKKHFEMWFSELMNNEIVQHMLTRMNEVSSDEETIFTQIFCLFSKYSRLEIKILLKHEFDKILKNNQQTNLKICSKVYCNLIYNILKSINSHIEYEKNSLRSKIEFLKDIEILIHSEEIKTELRMVFVSKKLPISIFYNFVNEDFLKFQKLITEVFEENSEELGSSFDYKDCDELFKNDEIFTKFENFISNFNNEKLKVKIFRSILFYPNCRFTSPITQSLKCGTIFFQKVVGLYELYKESNVKIQDFLTPENNSLTELILNLNFETYPIVTNFLKTNFNSNENRLKENLLKIRISSSFIENEEKFDFLIMFLNDILSNDENEVKKYIKKYLLILFESYDLALYKNVNASPSKFKRLVDLCLHYFENSYEKLRDMISKRNILFVLIFNKTDETNSILIDMVKKIYESYEMPLGFCFARDYSSVEKLFENKEKMTIFEEFLNELFSENKLKVKQICEIIWNSNFERIINKAIRNEEVLNNLRYFFKKHNFSSEEIYVYINIAKIFRNMDMIIYQNVKDFLFEIFSENKNDLMECIDPWNALIDFSYEIEKLKLFEEFLNEFFVDNRSLVDECMRNILFYYYDEECERLCEHFSYYCFKGSEESICNQHYPLICIFYDDWMKDIPGLIAMYVKYKKSWDWFQELFMKRFSFDTIEIFSKYIYNSFKELIVEVFKSKEDVLCNHILKSYPEVLENKNENCVDFCKTFNLIDLNDDSSDDTSEEEEIPCTSNQNKSEINNFQKIYDPIKMAELQKIADDTSSDDE